MNDPNDSVIYNLYWYPNPTFKQPKISISTLIALFAKQFTWFRSTCSFETLFNHSMSVMMMATIKLTMMMVPRMIRATKSIIVKAWESPELALSLLFHKSSNSNSPRTITKLLKNDLVTLSKDSFVLSKWIMKNANANAQTKGSLKINYCLKYENSNIIVTL